MGQYPKQNQPDMFQSTALKTLSARGTNPPAQASRRELDSINPLRSNVVLSKLPVHQLSKKDTTQIRLINRSQPGAQIDTYWKVFPNEEFGYPRQLAYRLDTLLINRKIDEAARPFPRIMRLGSLREIARELELREEDTDRIKNALKQNSSAYISLKIPHPTDGDKYFEGHGARYNLAVKGQTLPDGSNAETVYILWNEPFYTILNTTRSRPLNYSYLSTLPPAAQRFYELISFQFFAALKYGHQEAKIRYSEYCQQAPQNRYSSRQPAQNQMNGVHRHHRRSGYIAKLRWQKTTDERGSPDWFVHYTPGPKAVAEYEQFAGLRIRRKPLKVVEAKPALGTRERPQPESPEPKVNEELLGRLTDAGRGVSESVARKLLADATPAQEEHISDCIDCWDSIPTTKQAGLLIGFIRHKHSLPTNFVTRSQRRQIDEKNRKQREAQEEQERLKDAHQAYLTQEIDRQIASDPTEYDQLVREVKQKQVELAQRDHPNMTDKEDWATRMASHQARGQIGKGLMNFETFCAQQKQASATQEGTAVPKEVPPNEHQTPPQSV